MKLTIGRIILAIHRIDLINRFRQHPTNLKQRLLDRSLFSIGEIYINIIGCFSDSSNDLARWARGNLRHWNLLKKCVMPAHTITGARNTTHCCQGIPSWASPYWGGIKAGKMRADGKVFVCAKVYGSNLASLQKSNQLPQ
jgi:hypothetical protein